MPVSVIAHQRGFPVTTTAAYQIVGGAPAGRDEAGREGGRASRPTRVPGMAGREKCEAHREKRTIDGLGRPLPKISKKLREGGRCFPP